MAGWTRSWLGRRCSQPRDHEPQIARAAVAGWMKPWRRLTPTSWMGQRCGRSRDHGRGRVNVAIDRATAGCRQLALLSPRGVVRSGIPDGRSVRPRPRNLRDRAAALSFAAVPAPPLAPAGLVRRPCPRRRLPPPSPRSRVSAATATSRVRCRGLVRVDVTDPAQLCRGGFRLPWQS